MSDSTGDDVRRRMSENVGWQHSATDTTGSWLNHFAWADISRFAQNWPPIDMEVLPWFLQVCMFL